MGWWSQVIPKQEVDIDELQDALKEHKDVFVDKLKQTKKSFRESQELLSTVENALDIINRVEKKKK